MIEKQNKKFKRLFFDIETSPNLVYSWNIGRDISIDYKSIVQERAIICICWKWEHEHMVHSLQWNKGDDKQMLKTFTEMIQDADEIIGHNSDQFDIKWLRARCIYHGIPMIPDYTSVDTLKLSRKGFRFNSHRLDYIAKFLGLGEKLNTGFDLWKDIMLKNDKTAMKKMIKYCCNDVKLLEKVFKKLDPYVLHKSHKSVHEGGEPHHCPSCTSKHTISNGMRIMANGLRKHRMHCQNCGKYFSISNAVYEAIKPVLKKK